MSYITIDSLTLDPNNIQFTVTFTTDIDTGSNPLFINISYDNGKSYNRLTDPVTTSPYMFTNEGQIGDKVVVNLYEPNSTIESNYVSLTIPIILNTFSYDNTTKSLVAQYTYPNQGVAKLNFYYSINGGAFQNLGSNITSSPFIIYKATSPSFFQNGSLSTFLYDSINDITSGYSTVNIVNPTVAIDSLDFTSTSGVNNLNVYYTYPDQVNPLRFYYSRTGTQPFSFLTSNITASPFVINSNTSPDVFQNGTLSTFLFDTNYIVSSAISTVEVNYTTFSFDQFFFSTQTGQTKLNIYYTYPTQTNDISFYYSLNNGTSYTNLGSNIATSPFIVNCNQGTQSLFTYLPLLGYLYDSTKEISTLVSTTSLPPPNIPFSLCTITYGYDFNFNTDTLTAKFNDTYVPNPSQINYRWYLNGVEATSNINTNLTLTLFSNSKPQYFARNATGSNFIYNVNSNVRTNNFVNFTNPDFTFSTQISTINNTKYLFANLNYTYPMSTSTFQWEIQTSSSIYILNYSTNVSRYPLSTTADLYPEFFTPGITLSTLVTDNMKHSTVKQLLLIPAFSIDKANAVTRPTSTLNISYTYFGYPETNLFLTVSTSSNAYYTKGNISQNPIVLDQATYPNLFLGQVTSFFTLFNSPTSPSPGVLSTSVFSYLYPSSFIFEISTITIDPIFSTMNLIFLNTYNTQTANYKWYINNTFTDVQSNDINQRSLTLSNFPSQYNTFFAPGVNSNYIFDSINNISTDIFSFGISSFYLQLSSVQLNNTLNTISANLDYYQNNNGEGTYPSSFELYINNTFNTSISTTTAQQNTFGIQKTFQNQPFFVGGNTSEYQVKAISTSGSLLATTNTVTYTTPCSIYVSSIQLNPQNTKILTYFETNISSPFFYEVVNNTLIASTINSPLEVLSTTNSSFFYQYKVLPTRITNTDYKVSTTSNYTVQAQISSFQIQNLGFDYRYENLNVQWNYNLFNSNVGLDLVKYAWYISTNTSNTLIKTVSYPSTSTSVGKQEVINPFTFETPTQYFIGGTNWSTFIRAYSDESLSESKFDNSSAVGQNVSSVFFISSIQYNNVTEAAEFSFVFNIEEYNQDFTVYINNQQTTRAPYPKISVSNVTYPNFFVQGFNGNAFIRNTRGGFPPLPVSTSTVPYVFLQAFDSNNRVLPSTNAPEISFVLGENKSKSIMLPPVNKSAGKIFHFKYYVQYTTNNKFMISPYVNGVSTENTSSVILMNSMFDSKIDGSANAITNFGINNTFITQNASMSLLSDGNNWYSVNKYNGNLQRVSGNATPSATIYEPYGAQVSFLDFTNTEKSSVQLAEFGDTYLKFLIIRNSTATPRSVTIFSPSTINGPIGFEGSGGVQDYVTLGGYGGTLMQPNDMYSMLFSYCPSSPNSVFILGVNNITSSLMESKTFSGTACNLNSSVSISFNYSTVQTISSSFDSNHGSMYIYKNTNPSTSSFYFQTPGQTSSFFLLGSTNFTLNTITNKNLNDRQAAMWLFTTYSTNTNTINIPLLYYTP